MDSAFTQQFSQVGVGQAVAQVPADGQRDDVVREAVPLNVEAEREVRRRPHPVQR